jgi:GNAT superfamily N-acetyltransferase
MVLTEVVDRSHKKEFLKVPKILYARDQYWVCPLDKEIEDIFEPRSNAYFKNGDARRWILKSDQGHLIGRVAAFYNVKKAMANRHPTGGIGFFEVVEDQEAAFLLFDTAIAWLKSKNMQAADAPINFGENESHWGLLVEGFTHPGYGMPYNKPYYQDYFEAYGFRNYYEQYSYHKNVASVTEFPARFMKIADWVAKKPGYSFRHAEFDKIDRYVADMVEVYNSAWSVFKSDYTPMDPEKIRGAFEEAKFILDEELIWFAYHDGRPIAFFVIFPDFNQILKKMNGRLHLINKIRLIYHLKRHTMTRMRALIAGVNPKYQNIGIESVIFKKLYEVFRRKTYYQELELSWVGDFNPKMISIYEALGAQRAKTHITYRHLFDPDAVFIRYQDEMDALHARSM